MIDDDHDNHNERSWSGQACRAATTFIPQASAGSPLTMELPFTHHPGRRERHLRRRHQNPLFAWPPRAVEPLDLVAAQRADHEDLEAFRIRLPEVLQRAVELPADADSDRVLGLKAEVEACYEQTFALPADCRRERGGLARLLAVIMDTIRRHAGADPLAAQELTDEETARAIHFRLLEQPLVADLLHPQCDIPAEDLLPALLSASEAEVSAAVELFDAAQIAELVRTGEALLAARAGLGLDLDRPAARLALLRGRLAGNARSSC